MMPFFSKGCKNKFTYVILFLQKAEMPEYVKQAQL